jgi:hypothetical protein
MQLHWTIASTARLAELAHSVGPEGEEPEAARDPDENPNAATTLSTLPYTGLTMNPHRAPRTLQKSRTLSGPKVTSPGPRGDG